METIFHEGPTHSPFSADVVYEIGTDPLWHRVYCCLAQGKGMRLGEIGDIARNLDMHDEGEVWVRKIHSILFGKPGKTDGALDRIRCACALRLGSALVLFVFCL